MEKEIVYKKNYDFHNIIIERNGKEYLKIKNKKVPTDFETLLDYLKDNPSKFIEVLDGVTIALKIDKRKSLLFHKTLFSQVVDISVCNGSYRYQNFITLPIHIVFDIICQYK